MKKRGNSPRILLNGRKVWAICTWSSPPDTRNCSDGQLQGALCAYLNLPGARQFGHNAGTTHGDARVAVGANPNAVAEKNAAARTIAGEGTNADEGMITDAITSGKVARPAATTDVRFPTGWGHTQVYSRRHGFSRICSLAAPGVVKKGLILYGVDTLGFSDVRRVCPLRGTTSRMSWGGWVRRIRPRDRRRRSRHSDRSADARGRSRGRRGRGSRSPDWRRLLECKHKADSLLDRELRSGLGCKQAFSSFYKSDFESARTLWITDIGHRHPLVIWAHTRGIYF